MQTFSRLCSVMVFLISALSLNALTIEGTYYDGDRAVYHITKEDTRYYAKYAGSNSSEKYELRDKAYDNSGKYQYSFVSVDRNTVATVTDIAFEQLVGRVAMHVSVVNRGMGYEATYFKSEKEAEAKDRTSSDFQPRGNASCTELARTSRKYSEKDELESVIKNQFGSSGKIADWNELRKVEDITAWINCMDLKPGDSFMLTRNGKRYFSGKRQYFCRYAPQGVPGSFLVHASIGRSLFLGSWFDLSMPVLGRVESSAMQRSRPVSAFGGGMMGAADPNSKVYTPLEDRLITSSIVSQGRFYDPFNFLQVKPRFGLSVSDAEVVFSLRGVNKANDRDREFLVVVTGADPAYVKTQLGVDGTVSTHSDIRQITIPDNSPLTALHSLAHQGGSVSVMSKGVNLGYAQWRGEVFFTLGLKNIPEGDFSISLIAAEQQGVLTDLTELAFKPAVNLMTMLGEVDNPRRAFATYKLSGNQPGPSQIDAPLILSSLKDKKSENLYHAFMKYWDFNRPESLRYFDLNAPSSSSFGFGDLNGDGRDDGVVYWMAQATGGNLHHGGFAVFINDGRDNFTFLDMLGSKDYTSNMIIENQIIYGHEDKYKPSDARCCPSIKTAFEIRVENGKLQEKEVPRR